MKQSSELLVSMKPISTKIDVGIGPPIVLKTENKSRLSSGSKETHHN